MDKSLMRYILTILFLIQSLGLNAQVKLQNAKLQNVKLGQIVASGGGGCTPSYANTGAATLIDIGLPGIDGAQLASKIRDKYPKTCIFFVTGSSFIDLEEGHLMRIIRKPVTARALSEMIT